MLISAYSKRRDPYSYISTESVLNTVNNTLCTRNTIVTLYILLGWGLIIPLFIVFMIRVLLEYACFLFYLLPVDHLCTDRLLTQNYSELNTHETLQRVVSANVILKHYKSSSLITVQRRPCMLQKSSYHSRHLTLF